MYSDLTKQMEVNVNSIFWTLTSAGRSSSGCTLEGAWI